MLPRRLAVVLALTFGFLGATASGASAQTLEGEILTSFFAACEKLPDGTDGPECVNAILNPPPKVVMGECNPNGETVLTFRVEGIAAGPYPGTFVEDVTLTIGAQTLAPIDGPSGPIGGPFELATFGMNAGPIVRWDARFTIQSGDTQITGTKSLQGTLVSNAGFCATVENSTGGVLTVPSTGSIVVAGVENLSYSATIDGPEGRVRDSGNSQSIVRESFVYSGPEGGNDRVRSVIGEFGQTFQSTASEAGKPGLGCGDKNHIHVREGECKKIR